VVVDDGDTGRVDKEIEHYKKYRQDLQIVYVSLAKKTTIGEKRNRGCAAAVAARPDLSVFACMDDDDHYPVSSLSVRVAWLLASGKGCIYASTLPMYDITRYISAMNVPPLNLSPCERVSEATLCFTREFWEARGFPDGISVAEGEEFLRGREMATTEIPPNEVIISFLHGKNFTSRHVPEQSEPNGCHYGFTDQYFTLISQLAGLSV
jgi:glycosyltransferase involved in cell wall biosynthesis